MRSHYRLPLAAAWLLAPFLLLGGCDNVGRAFDPSLDSDGGETPSTTSDIQVVPVGGDVRDGRPLVKATYPEGSGWPTGVPIVVEFSESVNEASILPTTTGGAGGTDGRVGLRVKGTTQLLPCQYDLLAGGRLLVLRPVTALSNQGSPSYEVVLFPDGRDVDGVRFTVSGGETVLSEFQVNQDESISDGRILAVFPRDNSTEQAREGDVWLVFDRAANAATLVDSNAFVRPQGGSAVAAALARPLVGLTGSDNRVLRIRPDGLLAGSTRYELVVNDGITFGADGVLDFRGRTPFTRFTTVAPAPPTEVTLGNATPTFDNQINIALVGNAVLNVKTPADAAAGDRVRARIYGLDKSTSQAGDLVFVEREVTLPAAGEQTASLSFAGELGSAASPRFENGSITFVAQLRRGTGSSGFIHNDEDVPAGFDVTPPELVNAGPPATPDGVNLLTDQEYVNFYGGANEQVAAGLLTDGNANTAALFAADATGNFLMLPVGLARLTAPRSYLLTLTDSAGNETQGSAAAGSIVQRGVLTGAFTGTLTVEAYDEATLLPIAGATVLVDPDEPVPTPTAQQVATTDANGRASFAVGATNTVTIVRTGYDLVTVYATQASFVSLPLRATATASATATFRGTLTGLTPVPGFSAVVSNSAVADRSPLGIHTTTQAPATIPDTSIVPGRVQVVTSLAGVIEPVTSPPFAVGGAQLLGPDLATPTLPPGPAAAGGSTTLNLPVSVAVASVGALQADATFDFTTAVGLDTANLTPANPRVRVTASLQGFTGQVVIGLGRVTSSTGAALTVTANWSLPMLAGLVAFGPVVWLLVEAEDTGGRISRARSFVNVANGTVIPATPQAIPVITDPTGPVASPLAVTFEDVLAPGVATLACYDVTVGGANGRRWQVLVPDRTAVGGPRLLQLPALPAGVTGLSSGSWTVQVEARTFASVTLSNADDWTLTERIRQEGNYSRSRSVTFTVQ